MCDTTGVTSMSLRNPDLSPLSSQEESNPLIHHNHQLHPHSNAKSSKHGSSSEGKQNQVGTVMLFGVPIVSLVMDGKERLCLAQISSTLLKDFSYNEIHNRRVALGITCVQCTPVQLEILRRAGAMPVTSRRCGMITRREAERLCQSFLGDHAPPQLPENFAFEVYHECGWGCRGSFVPSRYNSSRAKCIRCTYCQLFFSPNKFIFHSHRLPESRYVQPDAANFNSWRRHLKLCGDPPDDIVHAWEDVRAMFNGGTRKRMLAAHSSPSSSSSHGISKADGGGSSSHHHHHHRSSRTTGSTKGTSSGAVNGSGSYRKPSSPSRQNHNTNHSCSSSDIASPLASPNFSPGMPHQHGPPTSSESSTVNSFPINPSSSSPSPNTFIPLPPSAPLGQGARVDSIWNPGIPASVSTTARFALNGGQLPPLPFHPLSIPWLRRPLFPFPHPLSPAAACHLLADAGISGIPEKLAMAATASLARGGTHSAFKPVTRTGAEHLFSWLNHPGGVGMGMFGAMSGPEDLSTSSSQHGHGSNHPIQPLHNERSREIEDGHSASGQEERSPVSSTNEDKVGHNHHSSGNGRAGKRGGNGKHQIQLLSNVGSSQDSEDEENVDIESTEVEEECSSTSFIWVTSPHHNNNNNNNNDNVSKSIGDNNNGRMKRTFAESISSPESCSGEDEKCEISPKIKRLWDFDAAESVRKQDLKVYCEEN